MEHNPEEHHRHSPASNPNNLAGPILIGAIIIAASIFYNDRVLGRAINSLTSLPQGGGSAQVVQPSAQAPADTGPVTVPERADAAKEGKGKVTLVEFSDFQCPFCQKFYNETYKQLKSKYVDTGKIQIIFRHYPLPSHQNAQKAAEASECANRQGKFWQYHDLLFTKGQSDGTGLAIADLKKYADELGLNNGTFGLGKNKFNQCLDNSEAAAVVSKDLSDAQSIGVTGTPTLFVNGKRIVGAQPLATFEQAIEEALKN